FRIRQVEPGLPFVPKKPDWVAVSVICPIDGDPLIVDEKSILKGPFRLVGFGVVKDRRGVVAVDVLRLWKHCAEPRILLGSGLHGSPWIDRPAKRKTAGNQQSPRNEQTIPRPPPRRLKGGGKPGQEQESCQEDERGDDGLMPKLAAKRIFSGQRQDHQLYQQACH